MELLYYYKSHIIHKISPVSFIGSHDDYVSHERKLHKRLFNSSDYYSVDLLPRLYKSHVINIWFGFELVKIVEVVRFLTIFKRATSSFPPSVMGDSAFSLTKISFIKIYFQVRCPPLLGDIISELAMPQSGAPVKFLPIYLKTIKFWPL